jgi:hypothetical protein
MIFSYFYNTTLNSLVILERKFAFVSLQRNYNKIFIQKKGQKQQKVQNSVFFAFKKDVHGCCNNNKIDDF